MRRLQAHHQAEGDRAVITTHAFYVAKGSGEIATLCGAEHGPLAKLHEQPTCQECLAIMVGRGVKP